MHPNIKKFFCTENSILIDIFSECIYPCEAIPKIKEFITKASCRLNLKLFDNPTEGLYIAKSAKVAQSACICPPCIIDENAEVRHCAYIRGGVVVGKNCVVGNSTELKNVILFDCVQVPHYNYVGDSILGYKAHMGAASITSNVKLDRKDIYTDYGQGKFCSNLKKLGAIIGDNVEIGCGSVLNPGCVIGCGCTVYPLSSVRGYVSENSIYKTENSIIHKR